MGHSLLVAFLKETVDDSEREYVETHEDPGDEQEDENEHLKLFGGDVYY